MKVGDKFKFTDNGDEYLLSQFSPNTVCLICVTEKSEFTGNRYSYPLKVKDVHNITEGEWKEITDGGEDMFKIIE